MSMVGVMIENVLGAGVYSLDMILLELEQISPNSDSGLWVVLLPKVSPFHTLPSADNNKRSIWT